MNNDMTVVGVNYHKTSLEVRNKFAFSASMVKEIYQESKNMAEDIFILSTCNRTEIYTTSQSAQTLMEIFIEYTDATPDEMHDSIFIKVGDEAIRHLYTVASGLDSQILGDYEIVRQIKNAFTLAKEHKMVSGLMEKLIGSALKSSKQIKANTSLSDGTTSTSYSVVKLLKLETEGLHTQHICLMGLGKIGALTLKNLRHYAPGHELTLINRDQSKSEAFAAEYGVKYASADQHEQVLAASDILVLATGADHALVSKNQIENSSVRLIFDLSVPSNLAPDVKDIPGLRIYDIDHLSKIVDETVENRKLQIPLAMSIIEENMKEYMDWKKRRNEYLTKDLAKLAA